MDKLSVDDLHTTDDVIMYAGCDPATCGRSWHGTAGPIGWTAPGQLDGHYSFDHDVRHYRITIERDGETRQEDLSLSRYTDRWAILHSGQVAIW